MNRLSLLMLVGWVLTLATFASAQIDLNPELPPEAKANKEAAEDFKAGDAARGVGKLNAAAAASLGSLNAEIHSAAQVAVISFWLQNEDHPRAREIGLLAVDQLKAAKGKAAGREAAALLSTAGRVCEDVLGRAAEAKAHYQAALALDGTEPEALAGLARIKAFDDLLAAKERENRLMRQNATNPIR
jgi:hypothetical protein